MAPSPSLSRWAGTCALVLAPLQVVSLAAWIAAAGWPPVPLEPPSADELLAFYSQPLTALSNTLELFSTILFLPVLVALFEALRERTRGLALVGCAFGALALVNMLLVHLLIGAILRVTREGVDSAGDLLREVQILHLVAESIHLPTIVLLTLFYLLWGLGLRRLEGGLRSMGTALLGTVLSAALTVLFFAVGQATLANIGIVAQVVMIALALLKGGRALRAARPPSPASDAPGP